MKTLVVGMGDCKASNDPDTTLVTYALGSCLAVTMFDPQSKVGAMLHFMLPDSMQDLDAEIVNQWRYADTGVPLMLEQVIRLGANKRRLQVKVAGGAAVLGDQSYFNIGRRNYAALKKLLWKSGILIQAEDVGGSVSRTVRLELSSGRFLVRESGGQERELVRSNAGAREGSVCLTVS